MRHGYVEASCFFFFYHLAKILLKCVNRGSVLTTFFHHCTDTFFSFALFFGKLLVIMKPDNKL